MLESYRDGRGKVDSLYFQPCRIKTETLCSKSSCQVFGYCPHSSLIFRNQCVFNSHPLLLHKKKPGISWIFFAPYPPFWTFPSGIPSDVSETSSRTTRLPESRVRIKLFPHQTHLQLSSDLVFLFTNTYRSLLGASSPGVREGKRGLEGKGNTQGAVETHLLAKTTTGAKAK